MAQKSNKPNREQNRIKIDMNIGQITDRNLNVRWLRNRVIQVTASQVPSYIRNLKSCIPLWSRFGWSNHPQKSDLWVQNPDSVEKPRPKVVTKISKGIRKINKLHPLPQSMRVLRYKLDSRDHYQKGTPQPFISKISQTETEIQNTQHSDEGYPSANAHGTPLAPQNKMVNDSNMQKVSERDQQTQVMTTNTSDRVQNQSSRKALMAYVTARRSFIDSTDSSADMNPDLAVVIKYTLVKMAQGLNTVTDEEPSVIHSNKKDNFNEKSVYEDSYTLEHQPDDTEYMVPSRENTTFW